MKLLCEFDWPGNVRQLHAVIRQGALQATGPVLLPAFLPALFRREKPKVAPDIGVTETDTLDEWIASGLITATKTLYDDVLAQVDRRVISRVLEHTGGSQSDAAKILGISRTTLRTKIERLGLKIERVVQSDE
jgi:two-component system nitrogen regulation response regulator GlnG